MAETAKLLLKARPTPRQLADRLRPVDGVWPDGLELYLAAADLADVGAIISRVNGASVPDGFVWLIEGPVDSLDGADFDTSRESEADREVLKRVATIARGIGAKAVNIHVIAPSTDISRLTLDCRAVLLDRAVPFLADFVSLMHNAGAVPTVEHMPPVLRMRRSDFLYSPIGMASADFVFLTERVDGLRVLVDTSHAGLYLNARREPPEVLRDYLRQLPEEPADLTQFLASFPNVENAQISNAQGILGEGLAYGKGDFDLDAAVKWLATHVNHVVTETLEANNDDAVLMRDALRHMREVLR
jgi:sugar phosphate isomerase/epimerase